MNTCLAALQPLGVLLLLVVLLVLLVVVLVVLEEEAPGLQHAQRDRVEGAVRVLCVADVLLQLGGEGSQLVMRYLIIYIALSEVYAMCASEDLDHHYRDVHTLG